jgi:hypothetical protein
MTELLAFVEERAFAPILLSPVNRAPDVSAIEFDHLGVGHAQRAPRQRADAIRSRSR